MDEYLRYKGKIPESFITKALEMYDVYKADKEDVRKRIVINEQWYKKWHAINTNGTFDERKNELSPATAFVFSAIENKYADAVDNFPMPNILEREPSDADAAKRLSKIIPVQLDISGFKKAYKDNWRKKLKHGTAIYGVFYSSDNIQIKSVSSLSVFCDMHLSDVQDSQFLYIVQAIDNETLREQYPDFKDLFIGDATYEGFDETNKNTQIRDRTEVIDCYYKKTDGSVHLIKFCKKEVIQTTEDTPGYEKGLYSHGKYPIVFDVLYPEEDCPFGFGVVDVIRNPQMYIDKLDGIILKNAILSGKQRWLVRDNTDINIDEFKNWDNDIIHTSGSLDEQHFKQVQAATLPNQVLTHRNEKINELKEIIGNRDFQQGGTSGGVTAASAITTLQSAGEKLSRAIIDDSYDCYKKVVIMTIELIREFFTEEKIFRITNESAQTEYTTLSANMLYTPVVKKDILGFPIETNYKPAEFDIEVVPQHQNPFSKETNNQTIIALWNNGFFNPQNIQMSMLALQSMNFDGRDKLIENLKETLDNMQNATQNEMMGGNENELNNTIYSDSGSNDWPQGE